MPFFSTVYIKTYASLNKDISQNMHFDVVLSVFIHPLKKAEESSIAQSWRVYLCACALDVWAGNFSHSTRLLLQQSRASFMLASYLQAVLISSPAWHVRLIEKAHVGGNT